MTTINVDFDEFQINVETQEQWPAGTGITWRGAYSGATAYVVNDTVSYLWSSYICILASTNNLPTNVTYWSLMASKWDNWTANITTSTVTDISWLLKGASWFIAQAIADTDYLTPTTAWTTYVTKNVAITGATKTKITYDAKWLVTSGTDATTADIADSTDKRYLSDTQKTEATRNASGSQNGLLSSTDWTTFNSKQDSLGFTPENVANKENTTLDTSATKYPTNRLVKEYADSLVVWLIDYRGGYDASVNTFPTTWGSWTAWAVIKGDMWVLSVAWTLWGSSVQVGDSIIANVDTPGQTAGNWNILNSNISYVPEDQANKETSALDTSVTKYPCNNVVKSAIEARYAILEDKTSDYTANSTNSWKMWMRSDEASSTVKWIIKTTVNDSYTYSVFDSGTRRILSNGNLTATHDWDGPSGWETAKSTIGKSSWKWYWEVVGTFSSANSTVLGIVNSTANLISNYFPGLDANGYWYVGYDTTIRYNWGTLVSWLATFTTNDVMWFALDMDSWTLKFYKNNVLQYTVTGLTWTWYAAVSSDSQTPLAVLTANFGATSMVYTAPAWYNQWLFDFASNIVYTNEQFPTKTYVDTKVASNVGIVWATKTKITYDTKWLVTSWADATTADIADSSNKRYVTDANLTVIWNTSWTNTGDETEATLLSKLTVFADSKNDTGFFDNTNISVSYDKTTRTITLTRGGWVVYYFQWKKYTLTSPWTSSAHTNSAGNYFLYSTDGVTFSWSTTPWAFDNIMVAMVMYDGSDGWAIREVHGMMDYESHKNAHNNIGTWRSSWGLLTAWTYTENTASDVANSPWFDLAVVEDEDVTTTIPAWTEWTYTTMYIWASSTATFSTVATLPFVSAGSYLQVNNPATGTMTNGINNRYYNVYQILVPSASDSDSQKRRMIMLQPQVAFTSLSSAKAEDPRSLSLGNFATTVPEFVLYARITYVTSSGDSNTGKCRIATGGVSYVFGNKLSMSSVSGSPTNHAWLTSLSWSSSGHTGSNLGAPLFDATGIATEVVPTAGQSVRVNAGGTAWEAYTPGSGLSWWASVNWATGTGVALAMDNSYASGGIWQSIIAGNTQTNALIGLKIDMGTSALNHSGLIVNGLRSATSNGDGSDEWLIKVNSYTSLTQLVWHTTGLKIWRFLNSNSAFDHVGIEVELRANSSTGKNTWMILTNLQTSFTPAYTAKWTGISITQQWAGGTGLAVYGYNNVNSSSTGIVNYTLSNTQSWATVFQKIDLGTSTQAHTGLLVNAYNASSSCVGVKIDGSTTATWYGLEFAWVWATWYTRIRFSNQLVPAGGSSIGINFSSSLSATTGTWVWIQFGSVSGGGSGTARAIYCPTLADNTGGGTWVLIQVDNLIGATSTTAPTSAKYYSFNNNQSAVLADLSVDPSEILFSRTCTRTTWTTTDNFHLSYLKRTSKQNGAGGTFSTTWSVQKLENVATQTAGTLTDSTTVLSLVQDNDSTGWHILFNSYSGSPTTDWTFWFDGTNFKARVWWATKTFTIT